MKHIETAISRETIYKGKVLTLHRDEVLLQNGAQAYREVVEHSGGVAILAMTGGNVLLVRQFRYPAGREMLELPAGKLNPGEDPKVCAARELEEETGCKPGKLRRLGSFYASPGYTSEILHLYLAEELTRTSQKLDADELLSVVAMPFQDALAACADGRISDAKTALALLIFKAAAL